MKVNAGIHFSTLAMNTRGIGMNGRPWLFLFTVHPIISRECGMTKIKTAKFDLITLDYSVL